MRRLLLILMLLCAPSAYAQCTGATVGPHQYCGGSWNSTNTATTSVTYSPTAGNTIVLLTDWCCQTPPTQTITSIQNQASSNLTCFVATSGTYYALNAPGPDDERWAYYVCPSINSGVTAIKVNWSASVSSGEVYILEFRGGTIAPTGQWDVDHGDVTGSAGLSFSVSATNVFDNDLMVAFLHNGSAAGPPFPPVTGDANWVTLVTSPTYNANNNIQVKAVSSKASQTASITWSTTNEQGFGVVAGLKAARQTSRGAVADSVQTAHGVQAAHSVQGVR